MNCLIAFLLALLCAASAAARQATPREKVGHLFESARRIPEAGGSPAPEAFEFERSGYRYRVASNGAGRRTKDGAPRLFNLRLEGADWIERVYFGEYEDNVVLVCEVRDGESGAGFVARLEQPSMRALWKTDFEFFNVGQPLRDGPHLYLTGHGFVAKLDLRTGLFVWRQRRLYGRAGAGTFNHFDPPEISGDTVLFREKPTGGVAPKTLRVNRKSGKILGIE
ncbi:MAG TPA: hypothetical protein VG148_15800 [Pyrinomonadaceae bacterium]|nr:hypothetical protein [Pyrinomonadaceae bacterium]